MNNYSKAKDELIYQGHLWAYDRIKEIGATHALTLSFSTPYTDIVKDEKDREQCKKILKYGMNNISKKIYGSHNRGISINIYKIRHLFTFLYRLLVSLIKLC